LLIGLQSKLDVLLVDCLVLISVARGLPLGLSVLLILITYLFLDFKGLLKHSKRLLFVGGGMLQPSDGRL